MHAEDADAEQAEAEDFDEDEEEQREEEAAESRSAFQSEGNRRSGRDSPARVEAQLAQRTPSRPPMMT